ncbi:MAG TPA: glycosyltransferase [Bacteroidia bacterium]|nr:glycosyltransferase [Bacteroidia bacterium]
MVNASPKITFFTPSFASTGSEIVLCNMLNSLSPAISAKLVSYYSGGSLWTKLRSKQSKRSLYHFNPQNGIFARLFHRLEKSFLVPKKLNQYKNSVWYINTIVLPEILEFAAAHGIRTIVHSHEMEHMYNLLSAQQLKQLIHYPELIIANSAASEKVLNELGRTNKIKRIYPAIKSITKQRDIAAYTSFRKKLGISSTEKLWVMCGTLDSNKNPELFIQTAKLVLEASSNYKFMWIGGSEDVAYTAAIQQMAKENNLTEKIIWTGNLGDEYLSYFNCTDGFMLCSKKESFSMVTIEALLLGIPVVANNCGGVLEILEGGLGIITTSATEMAEAILHFEKQNYVPNLDAILQRVSKFDANKIAVEWNKLLHEFLVKK